MSIHKTIVMILFVIVAFSSGGGKAARLHALADSNDPQVVTSQFRIFTDFSDEKALELASRLSKLHSFYNQIFNFDTSLRDQERLTVRYFATENIFDSYLKRILGRTYPNFVFLDYDDSSENELIIYQQKGDFDYDLARYSFVQFLEAFIPMAPVWIREGYALYFSNSVFDADQEIIVFQENDVWLETLKEIIIEDRLIKFERFFQMNEQAMQKEQAVFYPQAWGMVSFLVSYRKRSIDQVAQEVSAALRPNASQKENVAEVIRVLQERFDFSTLESDFREYILAKESISSLLTAAIEHYSARRLEEAEQILYNVISLDGNNSTPYYYLGLIHYDRDDHKGADHYYIQSLIRGASESTVYYALGLNAFADEDRSRARSYFDQAQAIDPTLFNKIDSILSESD